LRSPHIKAVAKALLKHETLTGDEIGAAIRQGETKDPAPTSDRRSTGIRHAMEKFKRPQLTRAKVLHRNAPEFPVQGSSWSFVPRRTRMQSSPSYSPEGA